MSISGFHFGTSVKQELSAQQRENDSLDFWTDVRGLYRTSLLIVDYSGAFTGLLLFATSRLRQGSSPLNAILLVPMMMVVPLLLTILRSGCEGRIADNQPVSELESVEFRSPVPSISAVICETCGLSLSWRRIGPFRLTIVGRKRRSSWCTLATPWEYFSAVKASPGFKKL
uniref:ABC transmembrane type-1 domain-containing protein n=1 Tax=Heterorhabditis bacteriophora TaxID=37862 RepID=A0A1I7WBR3_HETBA